MRSLFHALRIRLPEPRLMAYGFLFVLAWRISLEATNQIVSRTTNVVPYWPSYLEWVNKPANAPPFGLGHWAHWDGYHFLSIVLHGYHLAGPNGVPVEVAFFPAFPALVRVSSHLLRIDPVLMGLVINFLLSVVTAVALYKLAMLMCQRYMPARQQKQLDEHRLARISVLLLFFYPSSFFLAAFYADSLVVAGSTLAIYFAMRERYAFAAISSFAVMGAKTTGLVLIPTLLLILLENQEVSLHPKAWRTIVTLDTLRKATILMSGVVVALILYMTYLWRDFGDPLAFSHVESVWGRENSIYFFKRIFVNYYAEIIHPAHFGNIYQYISILFVMALPFATIWLSIWYARTYNTYWLPVMTVLTMLLPMMSGLMESLNRYTLILTPLAIALATRLSWPHERKWLAWIIILAFAGLTVYFAGGFLNGNYFAG